MIWNKNDNRPLDYKKRLALPKYELEERMINDVLYRFSSDQKDEALRSLELSKWDIDEYFYGHSYNLISDRYLRYTVMQALLEYSPIREVFFTNDFLACWSAFETPGGRNTWKDKDGFSYLDENSICRLFFCDNEQDVWEYFADGNGDLFLITEYYSQCDETELPFLMYLLNHTDPFIEYTTGEKYRLVPRYDEVIDLLKDYYGMEHDSFFSPEGISKAKEVWETGIEDLRVEFVKSEKALAILKQIL